MQSHQEVSYSSCGPAQLSLEGPVRRSKCWQCWDQREGESANLTVQGEALETDMENTSEKRINCTTKVEENEMCNQIISKQTEQN